MLWSLVKIVVFIALVAALTLAAGYLLETEGGVQITVAGTEYTLGPLQSVVAAGILVLAVWVGLKLLGLLMAVLHFINGDETAISRYFDRNRERRGFQALSEGLIALASGEGREAMAKASRAERYLRQPQLTNLLTAQAAEMAGDSKKAETVYKKLLADNSTRFVGMRGILKQKLAEGDTDTALELAKRAFALKPKHEETQDVLLRLQARKHDWDGARKTLSAKLKYGNLPRDVHKRRDAVLALSQAQGVFAEGASIEAREAAIVANRLSPDLIPAAVMAAEGYIDKGKPRYATRLLKKAWDARPHPDLAAAYARIVPDETPAARIKRFEQLVRHNADHRESHMLMAELHIAAEDFPGARRALGDLVENHPDARVLTIMAAIERGEGKSDAVVRGWLTRALSAPRGPQWVCDNCHSVAGAWAPVCPNCESFDTLSWTTPPMSEPQPASGVEMLPLIVGAPEVSTSLAETDEPEDAEVLDQDDVAPDAEKPETTEKPAAG